MKVTGMSNNCLNYQQLQVYSLEKKGDVILTEHYYHVSNCELCSDAVKGFASHPIVYSDILDINSQIDIKTRISYSITFKYVLGLITCISIILIFGFYKFANIVSKSGIKKNSIENPHPLLIPETKSKVLFHVPEIRDIKKELRQIKTLRNKLPETKVTPVIPINNIREDKIESSVKSNTVVLQPEFKSDVVYIYDLKVADYYSLYFKPNTGKVSFGSHSPSFLENKIAHNNALETETENTIAAEKILKKGLKYFNAENYRKSINEFQALLDNNPNDINALFYSALALFRTEKYEAAIKNLLAVLNSNNDVFHPEAKWNLALLYVKIGEEQTAKKILQEIANEKGFYAQDAEKLLNGFSY